MTHLRKMMLEELQGRNYGQYYTFVHHHDAVAALGDTRQHPGG